MVTSNPGGLDLALDVNLLGEASPQAKVSHLFYLTREALKRRQIDELWKAKRALSPRSLAKVLLSPAVLAAVQSELRRETGHRADVAEVTQVLRAGVIHAECSRRVKSPLQSIFPAAPTCGLVAVERL